MVQTVVRSSGDPAPVSPEWVKVLDRNIRQSLWGAQMTDVAEPCPAGAGTSSDDNELASLVRRWMGARRGGSPRPTAPPTRSPRDGARPERPDRPLPQQASAPTPVGPAPVPPAARMLPRRPPGADPVQARRLAVLIDARRIPEDAASRLLERVGGRGAVTVCRAYADWGRADLASWVERLRRHGLQSFHQLADDDVQARVALAIDAVDIAREAAVDEVVLAGDLTSMLPLLHRLHAAGVRVVVVGPAHTPHDVRAACDEFVDAGSLVGEVAATGGRHRA